MSEPKIRVNGVLLTEGQAMTVRVALNDFYGHLQRNGLGDDDMGKALAKAYIQQAASVLCMMSKCDGLEGNDGGRGRDE